MDESRIDAHREQQQGQCSTEDQEMASHVVGQEVSSLTVLSSSCFSQNVPAVECRKQSTRKHNGHHAKCQK